MKKLLCILVTLPMFLNHTRAQDTLKVVNWNMEYFGDLSSQLPEEMDKSKTVMDRLSADVYALVEVVNVDSLHRLVNSLNGNYQYSIASYGSFAPSPGSADYSNAQKMAFVYNADKIRNVQGRAFLKNSAGAAYYNWASGRFPFLVNTEVATGNNSWQPLIFVVVHAKAFSDNKSCLRRYDGGREMKDSLDKLYPDKKIILLGDFNDDFDISICGGPSNYEYLVRDSSDFNSYRMVTLPLSRQGISSTANYASFIDHVVISNELAMDYVTGSARVLKDEVEKWVSDYTDMVSDHYPVETKHIFTPPSFSPSLPQQPDVRLFPIPASDMLFIENGSMNDMHQYKIYSNDGRLVSEGNIDNNITRVDVRYLPENIYFIKVIGTTTLTKKFIVHH